MAKRKTKQPKSKSPNILDYPSSMSLYEKESRAAEAKLSEWREIQQLEELFKKTK